MRKSVLLFVLVLFPALTFTAYSALLQSGAPASTSKALKALSSETRSEDLVEVSETEEIQGNLIIVCKTLRMNGNVKGELLAGGMHLTVRNTVGRDLTLGGYNLDVKASVGEDARLVGVNVEVGGTINGDLIVFGANVDILGHVAGDLTVGGGKVRISGKIDGFLDARCGEIVIDGTIGRDVFLQTSKVTLSPKAVLKGDLTYTCSQNADIAEEAEIEGVIKSSTGRVMKLWSIASIMANRFPEHPESWKAWRDKLPAWIRVLLKFSPFFSLLLAGVIIISVYERHATMVADRIVTFPLKSFGLGLLFLICVPIGALILCLTIIGLPVGLVALAIYIAFSYISPVYVGLVIGRKILDRITKQDIRIIWTMALGIAIITGLSLIPYHIGLAIRLICVTFGLGGMVASRRKVRVVMRQES